MITDKLELTSLNLLRSIPDAVVVFTEDHTIVELSPWVESLFGYARDELIGDNLSRLLATNKPLSNKALAELLGSEMTRPNRPRRSLYGRHKQGTVFRLEISRGHVLASPGALKVIVMREMAEQDKALSVVRYISEELERRCDELEQFSYLASHDLKEPLRSISSFVTMLESSGIPAADENLTKAVGYIRGSVERMHALVHGLLDYCRFGEGGVIEAVDLNDVLEDVRANLSAALNNPEVSLHQAPLPTVRAVRVEMLSLFQNLISNAIKYRRRSEALVVQVEAKQSGASWEISVSDNGVGIPEAEAERIFQPFHRLQSQENAEGTGLGLAQCRKIVSRHGGQIGVTRIEPFGSRFTVTLPRCESVTEI